MEAVELYAKARHYLDAAKLLYDLAAENIDNPLRAKKLCVKSTTFFLCLITSSSRASGAGGLCATYVEPSTHTILSFRKRHQKQTNNTKKVASSVPTTATRSHVHSSHSPTTNSYTPHTVQLPTRTLLTQSNYQLAHSSHSPTTCTSDNNFTLHCRYVLAALHVERYRDHARSKSKDPTRSALDGLEAEDAATPDQTRMIDTAWRGAEAFHFLMLAQRQLYSGKFEAALTTAQALVECVNPYSFENVEI